MDDSISEISLPIIRITAYSESHDVEPFRRKLCDYSDYVVSQNLPFDRQIITVPDMTWNRY